MSIESLTTKILHKMHGVKKWQEKFLVHLFSLLLGIRGRVNFENMSRQSSWNESSYRNNYSKAFDFMSFNQHLVNAYCSEEQIIVFDPSFIRKSGKATSGLGSFWSGSAKRVEKGLEIGGFAAVDIQNDTAMHLVAEQTKAALSKENLLDQYIDMLHTHAKALRKQSKYLVADAYFSKYRYVEACLSHGFTLISKLRQDAVLWYPYLGPRRKGRGRPKKYAARVDLKQPDEQYFKVILKQADYQVFEAQLWVKSLKRLAKVILVHRHDKAGALRRAEIYFATDPTLDGLDLFIYYKARFQIEFLYRDAKQFAGLQHCQSRKTERLHFHFNASLTTVSLAKALHHLTIPIHQRKPFSLASIKTRYSNQHFIDRFFDVFEYLPKPNKNDPLYLKLIQYSAIAA